MTTPRSILDAIEMGIWDFEPDAAQPMEFPATKAMPGTGEKLNILTKRLEEGLPLWHPGDRRTYEDGEKTRTPEGD